MTKAPYVGQSKNAERYETRKREHRRDHPNANFEFEVLDRAEEGLTLDMAEETWIRKLGGPQKCGGPLANKRWQMSPDRYNAAGGIHPRP